MPEIGTAPRRPAPQHREAVWEMRAQQAVEYEVVLTRDLLDPANDALAHTGAVFPGVSPKRCCVVTEATVEELYGDRLRAYFLARGIEARWLVLDPGEEHKNIESVLRVVDAFDAYGLLRRQEPVVAVGGGVLTDIVGFACSTYRRGLPHIKVPTTLIGLVDAGIGAKTGVNHKGRKNRIGSYFPPRRTLLDPAFLATLPDRHITNGLAEILKIALVLDGPLFELLETHGPLLRAERLQGLTPSGADAADEVLRRAIGGMLAELEPNLWEEQLERRVDYGHSFSPALEMDALSGLGLGLLHGEAVAIDMALTTVISCGRGLLTTGERDRVLAVTTALGLPLTHSACGAGLLDGALSDIVRHRDGHQRLPLATGIGSARFVDDVTGDEVRAATAFLRTYGNEETYMLDGPDEWDELLVADVHGASAVHAMHGGADVARWKCLARRMGLAGTWEAIEWASLPPGAVCGEHRHTRTEELYFVISGEGEIVLDDVPHRIRPGHLVVNGLGTRHQFRNLGDQDLNWLVIEVFGPATAQALVGAGPSAERTS